MARVAVALDQDSAIRATSPRDPGRTTDPYMMVGEILEATRAFLGADAAYAGEFSHDRQVFHWIAGDASSFGLRPGASVSLVETLCNSVVAGSLPSVVNDTRADPLAGSLEITTRAGIRSYIGVPIVLPDGSMFGTLCAVRHESSAWTSDRDERFAHTMSKLLADQIMRIASDTSHRSSRAQRIGAVVRAGEMIGIALQPIVSLRTRVVVGEEALARFPDERPPAEWLNEAWKAGFGPELELQAMGTALAVLPTLPPDVYLSLNLSPITVLSSELDACLQDVDLGRIVLEITEHHPIDDYDILNDRLKAFRAQGLRVAVDDACAGFASLSHVVQLRPDIIKLDISLTRDVEHDDAKQALASSLMGFGARIGATVIAEGIQNEQQVDVLKVLGIDYGQGFLLGPPGHGLGRHLPVADIRGIRIMPSGDPRTNQHMR